MNVFETLADPTRRKIVETLRDGERPVNDIVAALSIHQSGVSRHLGILLEAGFVQMRPAGRQHLYSLRSEPFRNLEAWVSGYRALWEARLNRFDKALQGRRTARAAKSRSPEENRS